MSDAVRQVVSGQIQSFGRGLIKNVAGGIKDMIGGVADNSPGSAIQNKSKFHTKNLQYPMNVEGDPMQGHYILFGINQYNGKTTMKVTTPKKMTKIVNGIEKNMGLSKSRSGQEGGGVERASKVGGIAIDTPNGFVPVKDTGGGSPAVQGARGGNLYQKKQSMKRLDTSIALYMPASVNTGYSLNYSDTEIGIFSKAIQTTADLLTKGFSEGFSKITAKEGGQLLDVGTKAAKRGTLKMLDAVAPGIRAQAQITAGKILSNRMELSFQGINRREFSFTFVFMPKSPQEAQVVQQIIHLFKFHSHGDWGVDKKKSATNNTKKGEVGFAQGSGYEMSIPDTFDIQYMYQGQQNTHLNKISTCFCSSVQVAYGGDRYVAYNPTESLHGDNSPPPQRTTLTLTFKEMEILDRTRIDEGY